MKKQAFDNVFAERLAAFVARLRSRKLDVAFVMNEANQKGLIGFGCDNGCLMVSAEKDAEVVFYTDFRYIPAAKRECPGLAVRKMERFEDDAKKLKPKRIGYEQSISAEDYMDLTKAFRKSKLVEVGEDLLLLRAVKTPGEIARIMEAVALNDKIWNLAQREMKDGDTEKDIQRIIRAYMNALGDGEAFETIVCVGANAAECHHVPDETVWHKGDPMLVDMGVKLKGYCSDMTRCLNSGGEIYDLVLKANRAAIAAAKPGMTGKQLDAVARKIIRAAGHGKDFGHSLGHGVGIEIHEKPVASKRSDTVLKPGMIVTIEPGIYVEGKVGIRIEDMILITKDGCEVLTGSEK